MRVEHARLTPTRRATSSRAALGCTTGAPCSRACDRKSRDQVLTALPVVDAARRAAAVLGPSRARGRGDRSSMASKFRISRASCTGAVCSAASPSSSVRRATMGGPSSIGAFRAASTRLQYEQAVRSEFGMDADAILRSVSGRGVSNPKGRAGPPDHRRRIRLRSTADRPRDAPRRGASVRLLVRVHRRRRDARACVPRSRLEPALRQQLRGAVESRADADDLALFGAMSTLLAAVRRDRIPTAAGASGSVAASSNRISTGVRGIRRRPIGTFGWAERSSRTATSATRSATSGSRSTSVQCWELSQRQRGNCRRLAAVQDGAVEQSAGVANPRVRRSKLEISGRAVGVWRSNRK